VTTPLALSLLRDVYGTTGPAAELLDTTRFPTAADIENQLLDHLVTAAYTPRPGHPTPRYTVATAQRTLRYIATRLTEAVNVQLDNYPAPDRVLPTRRGNTLRAFEDSAGKQYGLDAITTAPHFFLIAPDRHMQYVRDSREQLDIAVKLCTVSLIATVITVALLLPDGLWLLMALAPYSFAYLAYRASIAAAQEHAVAVRTVIDLNRFALYESLRTALPKRTRQERKINQRLMALLQGDDEVSVRYADPSPLPPDNPTTP